MNWLFFAVIAVFAGYMISGWYRGVIKIVMALAALVISFVVTSVLAPQVSTYISENTKLYDNIRQSTIDNLKGHNHISEAIKNAGVDFDSSSKITPDKMGEHFDKAVSEVAKQLPLPQAVRDKLAENTLGASVSDNVNTIAGNVEDIITAVIASQIAALIINAGSYVLIFIAVYVVLRVVFLLANVVSKLPVLKELNKGLGILFGFLEALIVVWLFFTAVTMFYNAPFAQEVLACVSGNPFLEFLYDSNLILHILIR